VLDAAINNDQQEISQPAILDLGKRQFIGNEVAL